MESYHSDVTQTPDVTRYNRTILTRLNDDMFRRLAPAIAVLVLVMAVGVAGNVVICYIFIRKLRKSTQNFLLLCLGVFDLLSSCIGIPSEIFDMRHYYYYESAQICKAMRFLTTFPSLASILILLVIAADRYRKVCKPLNNQIHLFHARIVLIFIVVVALVFSVPAVYIYGHRTFPSPVPGVYGYDCSVDDTFKDRPYPLIYEGIFFACFVLCTIALVSIYLRIWLETRRHREYMKTHATFGRLLVDDMTTTSSMNYDSSNDDAVDTMLETGSRGSSVHSSGRKRSSKSSHRKRRRSRQNSDPARKKAGYADKSGIYKRVSVIPESEKSAGRISSSCNWTIGNDVGEDEAYSLNEALELKDINKRNCDVSKSSNHHTACNNNNNRSDNHDVGSTCFSNNEHNTQLEVSARPDSRHCNDGSSCCARSSADHSNTGSPTEPLTNVRESQRSAQDIQTLHTVSPVKRSDRTSQYKATSQAIGVHDNQSASVSPKEDEDDRQLECGAQQKDSNSTQQSRDVVGRYAEKTTTQQGDLQRISSFSEQTSNMCRSQSEGDRTTENNSDYVQHCVSSDSHSVDNTGPSVHKDNENPTSADEESPLSPEPRQELSNERKPRDSIILRPSRHQNDDQSSQSKHYSQDAGQSNRISFFIRSDEGFESNGSTEGIRSQRFSSASLRSNPPIRPLEHSKSTQSLTAKRVRKALRATRTTIIAFAITAGFILSYLPHLILIILRSVKTDFEHDLEDIPLIFYNIFIRSYFANNVINVFVYGTMNLEFRTQIVRMGTKIRSPFTKR